MAFEARYRTLADILESTLTAHAGCELFGTKRSGRWEWTSYAEFGRQVDRVRGGLAALGVQRRDCVAIVSNNRVEWAVLAYACSGLGAALVPMYEAQSPKEWEFIVRDCDAKVLVAANQAVVSKAKDMLEPASSLQRFIVLDGDTNGSGGERVTTYASLLASGNEKDAVRPDPEDTAVLIYTSGTTGNPKGVVLTQYNIASNVSAAHDIFPISVTDRSLSFLPWAHVFGQTVELHTMISHGASMAICEGVDKILDNLVEVRPTMLFSVPRVFNRIYTAVQQQLAGKPQVVHKLVDLALAAKSRERAGERLGLRDRVLLALVDKVVFSKVRARFGGRLKYAFAGGAALSREVAEFIDSLGIVVYEGYGLTETSPLATANLPGARKIGSAGRAVPGVRIEVDPAAIDSKPADAGTPARVEGEIVIYGPNVMKGYFKRPDENAAAFTDSGGFRTGDMGFVDADGYLFITGRIKEQYKLENGKYVVPTPLEEALKLSPYIANAMVWGDNKPYNVALVVPNLPAVKTWALASHIELPTDTAALLKDARVRALFQSAVAKHGETFKGFEAIRDFALLATDFTTDNGMLTPKLSLKRRRVVEAFGPVLEELYAKNAGRPASAASPKG